MDKKERCDSSEIGDYYYVTQKRVIGVGEFVGSAALGMQCRSQCIQNGEACPLYQTCPQKYEIREILP